MRRQTRKSSILHSLLHKNRFSGKKAEVFQSLAFVEVGENPARKVRHDLVRLQWEALAHDVFDDGLKW